jgi:hypothetical protein
MVLFLAVMLGHFTYDKFIFHDTKYHSSLRAKIGRRKQSLVGLTPGGTPISPNLIKIASFQI